MRFVSRLTALAGLLLVVAATAATQSWLDRHFLPSFFVPRRWYVGIETAVRVGIATAGVALVMARAGIARLLTRAPATTLQVGVAVALGMGAGEFAIRTIQLRPTEWLLPQEEPRRQDDPRLGWVLEPARTGHGRVGGRSIDYAIDAAGYRVRRVEEPVDPARPTIVFVGESVMFGEGLTWQESIPAQVGMALGAQSANAAVHGYSTDQMYLRLVRELPRFQRPVAVVAIFMTELFGRNLDDDRPHLTTGLTWQPAEPASRLMALAGLLVPYRRAATVEAGVRVTTETLRAIVGVARERGATALIVVPQFGEEDEVQRRLRARIFSDAVPATLVHLEPDWRLRWDRHPNADAAHVLASAIVARLSKPTQH